MNFKKTAILKKINNTRLNTRLNKRMKWLSRHSDNEMKFDLRFLSNQ